jgi:hypothetical protein
LRTGRIQNHQDTRQAAANRPTTPRWCLPPLQGRCSHPSSASGTLSKDWLPP